MYGEGQTKDLERKQKISSYVVNKYFLIVQENLVEIHILLLLMTLFQCSNTK